MTLEPLKRTLRALAQSWRALGVTLVLLGAVWLFLKVVSEHQPLELWLTPRYVGYAVACGVAWLSWFAGGHVVVRKLSPSLPLAEHLVLSTGVGLLAFALLVFLFGLAGFRGAFSFVVIPLALLAAGGRPAFRFFRRLLRHRRSLSRARRPLSPLEVVLAVLGVISLALTYFPIIVPDNLAYDARWYHMAIGEHYAAADRIGPFREGWFLGAYPQLASYLYTWAFLLPFGRVFDKAELAAHLEFTVLLVTLAGIQALVRRLSGRRIRFAWVALFAFPGRFVYDSALSGGADHVAAFWACPLFLAMLRAWPLLRPGASALLGAFASGALLTKYSALGIVLFPALAVLVRSLVLLVRFLRGRVPARVFSFGPAVALGTVTLLTAPHWLKNLIWYRDPIYPFGRGLFPSSPWTPDTADRMVHFTPKEWIAERSWQGVKDTAEALYQFSFVPHDWPIFHGVVPVFGSLFTLSVPCLLFLRKSSRTVALYAACHVAIAVWFWTFHQDRYLQATVPWMAAGVAAVTVKLWQLGFLPRAAVVLLGTAQLAWGINAPFLPAHSMLSQTPLKPAIDFLASAYRRHGPERLHRLGGWETVGQKLKGKGRLLLHEEHLHLGVQVPTVSDWIGWQGGISYGRAPSPDRVYDTLKKLGVTRLIWIRDHSKGYDSIAGDIAFHHFTRFAEDPEPVGAHVLARMPKTRPPPDTFRDRALFLGCETSYSSGLYHVSDLTVTVLATPRPKSDYPPPRIPLAALGDVEAQLPAVDALVVERGCANVPNGAHASGFTKSVVRATTMIYLRPRE